MPLSYELTTFQIPGQKLSNFFVGILVETMTPRGHFEINWPLVFFIFWKARDDANWNSARRVVFHASQILNHISLKTRVKLTTISYISLNSDYTCSRTGLEKFVTEELNTTSLKSEDCGTMMSNNGGVHMLLTNEGSGKRGVAHFSSICECINRWVMDSTLISLINMEVGTNVEGEQKLQNH